MKILVQSDDYGFTRGVIAGMVDAFERGIITSTGLFANMPCCEEAVKRIQAYPHICLGIDINVTSGPCVSDPQSLPTLVNATVKPARRSKSSGRSSKKIQNICSRIPPADLTPI